MIPLCCNVVGIRSKKGESYRSKAALRSSASVGELDSDNFLVNNDDDGGGVALTTVEVFSKLQYKS